MMSVTMATTGLLKMKIFLTKSYDVIIFVLVVTNKILSHDSNYNVNVAV